VAIEKTIQSEAKKRRGAPPRKASAEVNTTAATQLRTTVSKVDNSVGFERPDTRSDALNARVSRAARRMSCGAMTIRRSSNAPSGRSSSTISFWAETTNPPTDTRVISMN
jgi:hypothetical protein